MSSTDSSPTDRVTNILFDSSELVRDLIRFRLYNFFGLEKSDRRKLIINLVTSRKYIDLLLDELNIRQEELDTAVDAITE